ncbi:MAG: transferase, partial [Planctomycetes bacterium]|nr:transferase [Planctomycetota bacterium]
APAAPPSARRPPQSHGDGRIRRDRFRALGTGVVFERGALVFHPENVEIGDNVYIGHYAILKGYYRNTLSVGDGTWIGQACFFHAAGGLTIGRDVGIGPGVMILTSQHDLAAGPASTPVLRLPVTCAPVVIGDGCDLGAGAIVLPGVTVGAGAVVGAGSVVTRDVPPRTVVVGAPARAVRRRR